METMRLYMHEEMVKQREWELRRSLERARLLRESERSRPARHALPPALELLFVKLLS